MATAAKNPPATESEAEVTENSDKSYTVAARVDLATWQKIKYASLRQTFQAGENVTISTTAGRILTEAAEGMPEPPAELLATE